MNCLGFQEHRPATRASFQIPHSSPQALSRSPWLHTASPSHPLPPCPKPTAANKHHKLTHIKRMRRLYILDLFSGTGSVSEALKRKFGSQFKVLVHSVDIHPKYNPTTQVDILRWNYKRALRDFLRSRKPRDVFIAHASPPCTEYSRAKTTAPRNLRVADAIAKRTLRIVRYAKPDFWTLENPTGLLRSRVFMQPLRKYRKTCSYC